MNNIPPIGVLPPNQTNSNPQVDLAVDLQKFSDIMREYLDPNSHLIINVKDWKNKINEELSKYAATIKDPAFQAAWSRFKKNINNDKIFSQDHPLTDSNVQLLEEDADLLISMLQ